MLFLGQVGEVEIDGKCPGDELSPIKRPASHQRRDLITGRVRRRATVRGAILASSSRASAVPQGAITRGGPAGGDHRQPQPLDIVEQVLATGLAQHLAKQIAEQPDIPAHRLGHLLPVGIPAHAVGVACHAARFAAHLPAGIPAHGRQPSDHVLHLAGRPTAMTASLAISVPLRAAGRWPEAANLSA